MMLPKTLLLATLLCFGFFAQAQPDEKYKATFKKMLEVSGSEETYRGSVEQMISMFKTQSSLEDERFWSEFGEEMLSGGIDSLAELLVPVYFKYLTISDMEKIIEFYQTPVGKKYAETTPMINQESMQVGQQWGMQIAQKMQQRIQEKQKK